MAECEKYNNPEIEGIPPDEPIFILRGQDRAALLTLVDYAANCTTLGSPQEHIEEILDSVRNFAAWQVHDVKTPD